MPIRPEFRRFYGPHWRAYRALVVDAHIKAQGNVCPVCGLIVAGYFNLAHLTHDPRRSEVALMCAACHNRHDAAHRLAVWRRNRARRAGQLWLWPEVEYAPTPTWLIPRAALPLDAAAQERLL